MDYETWLNSIEKLKSGYIDNETLQHMQNSEINNNINSMLIPKLDELIRLRFENSINKLITNLREIYSDINFLDMSLVNLKKELTYIKKLIYLKQIPYEKQKELSDYVESRLEKTYDILTKEAINVDPKGIYAQTINYNKIKWSDLNEL